jgi:hypothetical protein
MRAHTDVLAACLQAARCRGWTRLALGIPTGHAVAGSQLRVGGYREVGWTSQQERT